MLAIPSGPGSDPDDLVTGILLDFVLGHSGSLSERSDFVAPPRDWLRQVASGRITFNGVQYELTWLTPPAAAEIVGRYDLHTWGNHYR